MDYKELLKKYWFVGIVAIALMVFVGIYAADTYKNRKTTVPSKQIDGKYAVYSVDGDYVMADDFYDSLFTDNGLSCSFVAYQRAILDDAYETTEEMSTVATNYASYMYQSYGADYINSQLKLMGYVNGVEDLTQYYIDSQKNDLLISDYLKLHYDDVAKPFIDENNPRVIYHILVKVADVQTSTDADGNTTYVANPTEEEKAKLDAALEALKTQSFEEVATQYSDDGSAQIGGLIGCVSNINSSNYVKEFSNTSLSLGEDEVSEPIVSQYGYHIIWNAGSSQDVLLNDPEFITEIRNNDPVLSLKAVMEKADELGYEIVDEYLAKMIKAQLETAEVVE